MKQLVFKKGDRVFDIEYGWGNVYDIDIQDRHTIRVIFDDNCKHSYLFDGMYADQGGYPRKVLSFTEYKLEGFSQERPEELPKKGQIVWGRDEDYQSWHIYHFSHKTEEGLYALSSDNKRSVYCLKQMTTKNPFENEETEA